MYFALEDEGLTGIHDNLNESADRESNSSVTACKFVCLNWFKRMYPVKYNYTVCTCIAEILSMRPKTKYWWNLNSTVEIIFKLTVKYLSLSM